MPRNSFRTDEVFMRQVSEAKGYFSGFMRVPDNCPVPYDNDSQEHMAIAATANSSIGVFDSEDREILRRTGAKMSPSVHVGAAQRVVESAYLDSQQPEKEMTVDDARQALFVLQFYESIAPLMAELPRFRQLLRLNEIMGRKTESGD